MAPTVTGLTRRMQVVAKTLRHKSPGGRQNSGQWGQRRADGIHRIAADGLLRGPAAVTGQGEHAAHQQAQRSD